MITRRTFAFAGLTTLVPAERAAQAQSSATGDPVAIVSAIYTRAASGKGDSGGSFIIANRSAKQKYLSKPLTALWAKADAHTPKGDVGPVDFDPVTNSQDPDVKSFDVHVESRETEKATIAVTITGHGSTRKPADQIVRYEFVRETGQWKIDDIKGASDGEPWSIRDMLSQSLKN